MSRAKKPKEVFGEEKLELTEEEKRFATPKGVAQYRAERLACDTILDLCCGAGFQSFAFAQTCKKVIGIEKRPELVAQARKYAKKLGIKNVEFVCGDVLSSAVLKNLPKADVVFCDPERPAAEVERKSASIEPNIQKVLEIYQKITPNVALELPPHFSDEKLPAEYEYLALHGVLNRLTLYFGTLQKAEKSLMLLPENKRIEKKNEIVKIKKTAETETTEEYNFILEPNPAVNLADLLYEALCFEQNEEQINILLQKKEIVAITQGKKTFLLSTKEFQNPFFAMFRIVERVPLLHAGIDKESTSKALQLHDAGKVVLRYPLEPQEYWKERTYFEKELKGTKTVHVFCFGEVIVVEKQS